MEIAKENGVDPDEAATTYSSSEDEMMYGEEYSDLDNKIKRALFWTDTYLNSNCFENAYERVIDAYNNLKPFPEVVDTLKEIKARGYTIAMMSNSMKSIMDHNRKALGNVFEIAYLADEIHDYKPRLSFFKYVHEKLDFDHNPHTHVAAGYWWDIFPATEMKWPNKIWVNRDGMKKSPLYDPQIEVHNLAEVLDHLPPLENKDL